MQASVAEGIFHYTIPADTFWDPEDGFNLLYIVDSILQFPSWLLYYSDTRTFVGVPTQEDVGVYGFSINAMDDGGLSAVKPHYLAISVPVVIELPSSFSVVLTVRTASRRRAVTCNPLDPALRVGIVEGTASFFNQASSTFNLRSIQSILTGGECTYQVVVVDESASNCGIAQERKALLDKNPAGLQEAINTASASAVLIESYEIRADACEELGFPSPKAAEDDDFQVGVVPLLVPAVLLALIGTLAFVLLRRVKKKQERGINDDISTFEPRQPVVLPSDRQVCP